MPHSARTIQRQLPQAHGILSGPVCCLDLAQVQWGVVQHIVQVCMLLELKLGSISCTCVCCTPLDVAGGTVNMHVAPPAMAAPSWSRQRGHQGKGGPAAPNAGVGGLMHRAPIPGAAALLHCLLGCNRNSPRRLRLECNAQRDGMAPRHAMHLHCAHVDAMSSPFLKL